MPLLMAAFSAVAISAEQDVFEIVAPGDSVVRIREVRIGQYSDFGDAQDELLSILFMRGHTAGGSGGSALSPVNVDGSRPGTAIVKANNTGLASGGSPETLLADAWNVRAGFFWKPSDFDERIRIPINGRFVVRISAPADSLTGNGTIVYEEVGLDS